jgi:hypothetical protein
MNTNSGIIGGPILFLLSASFLFPSFCHHIPHHADRGDPYICTSVKRVFQSSLCPHPPPPRSQLSTTFVRLSANAVFAANIIHLCTSHTPTLSHMSHSFIHIPHFHTFLTSSHRTHSFTHNQLLRSHPSCAHISFLNSTTIRNIYCFLELLRFLIHTPLLYSYPTF